MCNKFNWYKIAISQEDFYKMYAYEGLSDEDLRNNPVFLFEMIEHLNHIRIYYLEYLFKEIGDELNHILAPGSESGCFSRLKSVIEDSIAYKESFLSNQAPYVLKGEIKERIKDVVHRFYRADIINNSDLDAAKYWFSVLPWNDSFGGRPWADVVDWTKELRGVGNIAQEEWNPGLMQTVRKLIFVLDTIHSISHNTNMLLIDLPEKEKEWLFLALEIVKHSEPVTSAFLSQDKKLMEYYRREKLPLEEKEWNADINYGDYKNTWSKLLEKLFNLSQDERLKSSFYVLEKNIEYTLAMVNNSSQFEAFLDVIDPSKCSPEFQNVCQYVWHKFDDDFMMNHFIYGNLGIFRKFLNSLKYIHNHWWKIDNILNSYGWLHHTYKVNPQVVKEFNDFVTSLGEEYEKYKI